MNDSALPPELRDLLIGLAGDIVGKLLDATGRGVRKLFAGDPQQNALRRAVAQALADAFHDQLDEPELFKHYVGVFAEWAGRDEVTEQLTQLIDPRPDIQPDMALLRREFEALPDGYDPDWLGVPFEQTVLRFIQAFRDAAGGEPALEGTLKIQLLRQAVARLEGIRGDTAATARHTERAADNLEQLNAVAQAFWRQHAPTQSRLDPAERQKITVRYLAYLVDRYRYLDFKGMGMSDRVSFSLPLVTMYVPLKARTQLTYGETWTRNLRLAGRVPSGEELDTLGQRLSKPQPVLELLREYGSLILLGDPGAGKTTFLKYLAVRLAQGEGEALGLGRRLPLLLPLAAYAEALSKGDITLDDFIPTYYWNQGIHLPLKPVLDEALAQGGALFLLDGLDEVQDLAQRHLVVDRVLSFVAFHQAVGAPEEKKRNLFILTSRIVGYADVRRRDHKLAECTLVDFEQAEIEAFVDRWTAAVEQAVSGGETPEAARRAAQEKRELLEAMQRNPGVRQLATNPLLLTILALMKRQGVALPERRVELYDQYIKTLVRHWNLARSLDRPIGRDLDVVETTRILGALALWMQENSPGRGLVKQGDTQRELERIYRARGHAQPEQAATELLRAARDYAGLLVARGDRRYGFIHLTFQEYLAAVGVAQQGQSDVQPIVDTLGAHVGEDAWREVALLTIGYLGLIQQRDVAAGEVLTNLMAAAPGEPGEALFLAAAAVRDVWPGGVTQACHDQVVTALQTIMVDRRLPMPRRAEAGRVLAQVGDPRPGVGWMLCDGLKIPDIAWGEVVPAGKYGVGDDSEAFNSFKKQTVDIAQAYQLARYLVTYAQFQCFVEAADFGDGRWWQGMPAKDGYGLVRELKEQAFKFDNHPRENVSWYQAVAFSRWLSDKLGYDVDLPTEYEWEVAARYPDGRFYPWGNSFDSAKANVYESGIKQTSAVGIFAVGANPALGLYDLSGNVWEWCRNKYEKPADTQVDKSDALRTLRGGSWNGSRGFARASSRWVDPDFRSTAFGFRLLRRLVRR